MDVLSTSPMALSVKAPKIFEPDELLKSITDGSASLLQGQKLKRSRSINTRFSGADELISNDLNTSEQLHDVPPDRKPNGMFFVLNADGVSRDRQEVHNSMQQERDKLI